MTAGLRKLGVNGACNDRLLKEIRQILVDSLSGPCGGLFASELLLELKERGIEVSRQRLVNFIQQRGNHIKIMPIKLHEGGWLNMYYAGPSVLDLNNGKFMISSNLPYYDPRREIPILEREENP